MYQVVQFSPEDGGSISIVHEKWLTPRKTEVYWPPVKEARAFDRLLCKNLAPDPKWKTYHIQRTFYETDELEKAKQKLKLVEVTSDIQTDDEMNKSDSRPKRQSTKSKRLISSDDDEQDESGLNHPPPLKKQLSEYINQPGTRVSQQVATPTKHAADADKELTQNPGFEDKIVSLLCQIKKQNDAILAILKEKEYEGNLNDDFKFPLNSSTDLIQLELLLKDQEKKNNLVEYLRRIGGRDLSFKVSRVLKFLLTDCFAAEFNFYGKRTNKKPFSQLLLCAVVIEAIKVSTPTTTEKNVEDCIKVWLKHAPEREKKRLTRTKDV